MPAQTAPSELETHLSSLYEIHAFSFADFAYSELITSKFNDALRNEEKLERIKPSSAWDIISQYPSLFQPVCRVISCLPSTLSTSRTKLSHLELVLRENCAWMENNVTDAIIFLSTINLV